MSAPFSANDTDDRPTIGCASTRYNAPSPGARLTANDGVAPEPVTEETPVYPSVAT